MLQSTVSKLLTAVLVLSTLTSNRGLTQKDTSSKHSPFAAGSTQLDCCGGDPNCEPGIPCAVGIHL